MDCRVALRIAFICFGGVLLMTGCPAPPASTDPPASTPLPTTAAEASSANVRTLTIPTEQLPSRTSTEPTAFACGIPGVECAPTQTPTTTEEIDDPSPTP